MKKRFLFATLLYIAALIPVSSGFAQGTLLRVDYPERYTVADGDTLWNIASQFLQDPERWPEIWRPDPYLDNADLIFPGDTLRLNFVGGNPRIMVLRGDREVEQLGPQIRSEALSSAIPAIPLEAIESSFTRNRIISQTDYDDAPYIVQNLGSNLAIATGDEVYARGQWPTGTGTFEIYRSGRVYQGENGAETDEVEDQRPWWRLDKYLGRADRESTVIGLEVEYLGFATIIANEGGDLRRLLINNSFMEIQAGDRLLIRQQERIDPTIFPTEPGFEVEGEIIAFLNGEAMASQLDTAVVNLGAIDGLEVGDVLAVRKEGSSIVDDIDRSKLSFRDRMMSIFRGERLQLPGNEIGTLLVYKVFDQLSYAVILSSLEPIEVAARIGNP